MFHVEHLRRVYTAPGRCSPPPRCGVSVVVRNNWDTRMFHVEHSKPTTYELSFVSRAKGEPIHVEHTGVVSQRRCSTWNIVTVYQ